MEPKKLFQDALAKGIDNKQTKNQETAISFITTNAKVRLLIYKQRQREFLSLSSYLPVLLRKKQQTTVQTKTALTKPSTTKTWFYKKYLPLHYIIIQVWRLAIHCDFGDSLGLLLAY